MPRETYTHEPSDFETYLGQFELGSTQWQAISDSVHLMLLEAQRRKGADENETHMALALVNETIRTRENGPDAMAYRLAMHDFNTGFGERSGRRALYLNDPSFAENVDAELSYAILLQADVDTVAHQQMRDFLTPPTE